ncbi:cation:dicarboxylate symporter family transporter [Litorilituus sediminis]|uniref:Cation:dicarboxylase symporter family transporter n=1 Tax=Litorilituus sediminis TaxID=718192 RepID=A0A4P6P7W4_9GAMM|nr:cation:dicarboxylase symporter family transporter [Litorilituus sediminis]QBG35612.1 cation:dicarboxylase symporter family transporter [Litorilituus sediminis]
MPVVKFYKKLSPFQRVIIALLLGIATGIFVGEPAGELEVIGNVYIRLLQMTVLPYVLVSIIGGLGRLDSDMAASIGVRAVKVILIMWLSVMCTLLLLPLAYPNWQTGGFFSTSMVAEPAAFNFIKLYIPSNIFASLSETIVPAVVLFSLLMGIALINVKNKETLLTLTTNVGDSLMKVASYVAKLAPLGIFAISASAAGTLEVEELGRLQIFLWVYIIAAALLTFVFLPLLIHWATPLSYKEVLSTAGEAVITAIATGTVLVVLPMIIDRCKELLAKHKMECEETNSTVDVLVPTAYSFPSTGTLLGLGFVLFSAWYVGSPLGLDDYISFVVMGALTAFGSMAVAIPFLLDFFDLPADQFQLYLLGSVVTARFATGLAALHGFVVTLLVASAVLKKLRWHRLMQAIAVHLGVTFGVMIAAGLLLTAMIPYKYEGVQTFESLKPMAEQVAHESYTELTPLSQAELQQDRLDIILARGSIRVGYFNASLPYAFSNKDNQIVGFDVEIINEFARDLGVKMALIRIKDKKQEAELLANGSVDITIGGKIITPLRALKVAFSDSYTYHTAGLLISDSKRDDFADVYDIKEMKKLNLGIGNSKYYSEAVKEYFPNATLTPVTSVRNFLKGKYEGVDALIFSTEAGSAWAMLYPNYSAVIPKGMKLRAPVGFTLPKGQLEYVAFINTWLKLKEENGFQKKVYDYWILGENPKAKKPRWSVMKDVLGWI